MISSIATLIFMPPFFWAILYVFDFELFPVVVAAVVLVGNGLVFGHIIWATACNRVDFYCELTDTTLSCTNSVPYMGQSFVIPIDDIVEIQKDSGGEGGPFYRIKSNDGKLYRLTNNYGNPAGSFMTQLQKLRPDIPVVQR